MLRCFLKVFCRLASCASVIVENVKLLQAQEYGGEGSSAWHVAKWCLKGENYVSLALQRMFMANGVH